MTVGVPIPFHLAVHLLGLTVAAGLAVYAVARRHDAEAGWAGLAVGGLLLAASHLVGGALIADDVAWPLYLRAAGYAGVAVGSAGRLLGGGTATVIAAAPTGAYLTAAAAGAAAAVASFRGVLGRRRDAVVLAGGIALWAVSDLAALRAGSLLPGIVSIAGSLTLGGWLVWRSRETLLSRVVTSFLAALLVLLVGLGALGGVVFTSDLQRDAVVALQQSATGRAVQVTTDWTVEVLTTAKLFARGTTLADRLTTANRDVLQRSTAPAIAELPNVDLVLLLDAGGDLLASYDWGIENRGALPPSESLLLLGDDVVQRAVRGLESSGLVVLGVSDVVAVGAEPVFAVADGQPQRDQQVGVLAVGRRVTDPLYLEDVAATSGAEATVVVGGSAAASTLGEGASDVAAAIDAGVRNGMATVDGEPTLFAAAPLGSPPATVAWLVLSEDAGTLAGAQRALARTLFLAVLAGLLAAAVLAAWAATRTTRPLRRLTAVAERVAAGERDVRTGIDQPDEVGRLADAFDRMTTALVGREQELRTAAQVEAALRKRLEVLTASMGEGLVAVGADGAVQTINPAAQRLLGTSTERAVGRPVSEVLVGVEETGVPLLTALGGADAAEIRAARGHIGRDAAPVAATAAPLVGQDGRRLGRVYVLRDVSGEAEVERMKTEFLANMSHELRTPLTPIKGYAEVLRRRDLPHAKVADFADQIATSTARLERVIGMLVDFAALEAGRMDVRPVPTQLDQVVGDVLRTWRERQPARRFTRYVAHDLPPVHVDPRLLARVLEELIDNAVKFSDGPVRLVAEPQDGRVRLTVRDRGVGMTAEEVEAIGRDFHQADSSATRRYGGLGLGLSLVRRIANRFGAEVRVDSTPGRGTDVHLLLPVVPRGDLGAALRRSDAEVAP